MAPSGASTVHSNEELRGCLLTPVPGCHGPSREATFNASWPIREPGGIPDTLHGCAGLLRVASIGGNSG
jgi:hypothetical protein